MISSYTGPALAQASLPPSARARSGPSVFHEPTDSNPICFDLSLLEFKLDLESYFIEAASSCPTIHLMMKS